MFVWLFPSTLGSMQINTVGRKSGKAVSGVEGGSDPNTPQANPRNRKTPQENLKRHQQKQNIYQISIRK